MRIRYWGVRGSIAVPGPSTLRFGGNTPCVSVELSDRNLLILDGGTGLRGLGQELLTRRDFTSGKGRATMLFTHRHWDHIQGLPFFEPAYVKGNRFEVFAPQEESKTVPLTENVVALQINEINFPLPFDVIKGAYGFHLIREETPFSAGAARIHPIRMNHAGCTLGYVITEARRPRSPRVVYLTDTAPWDGVLLGKGMADEGSPEVVRARYRQCVIAAIAGADLVIADTSFDEARYVGREDWGHSTPSQALALCREARVRRMHLFHFEPAMDDGEVARLEAETRAQAGGEIEVTAAAEGLEVTLD